MGIFGKAKEARQKKKLEKIEQQKERELAIAKKRQAELEAEQEKIVAERNRLLGLDTNELIVEAILAIRGFYNEFIDLRDRIEDVEADIENLESKLASIKEELTDHIEDEELNNVVADTINEYEE